MASAALNLQASGFLSMCGVPCGSTTLTSTHNEDETDDKHIAELLGSTDIEDDDAAVRISSISPDLSIKQLHEVESFA